MKERIQGLVGDSLESKLILGTFHSVARRYLVRYGQYIGIKKDFGIADSNDTMAILKRIIKRRSFGIEPGVARSRISKRKAQQEGVQPTKGAAQQDFEALFEEYEETLRTSNLLDYDDLLLRCADLLREHPECVSNVEAVLIDEFQDTNHVQYDLMNMFAQTQQRITIVGDPDQSIYGFRSAEIKNLTRMQNQYPDTQVVLLAENYRSSGAILSLAMEVIEQDQSRPNKRVMPTHGPGVYPVLRKLPSAPAEAMWIVTEIQRSRALTGNLLRHSDFAILLRSASLSRLIELELGKAGVPYRMVGGHKFFDRHEIKVILNYLRVISQPDHNDALAQTINVPSRKVGETTVKGLLEEAEKEKLSLWQVVLTAAQGGRRPRTKISKQAEQGLGEFANIILTSTQKLRSIEQTFSVCDLVKYLLKKLSFEDYLRRHYPEDFDTRWANVEELVVQASDMSAAMAVGTESGEDSLPEIDGVEQRAMSSAEDALAKFLANVALSTEVVDSEEAAVEKVTISTIHAAKGLEWPVVFIPAAYEGSLPHSRAEDHDEERRLLYVGMTRAQALLYLSCPTRNSSKEQTTLSPFLSAPQISRFHDFKGPSFGFTAAQDLSRILRRPCPTTSVIEETLRVLTRTEDDLYPYDGEEISPENSYWDDRGTSHTGSGYDTKSGYRRRRLDNVPVHGFTTSTTMYDKEYFSIATTTVASSGFMSATTLRKELATQRVAQPPRLLKRLSTAKTSDDGPKKAGKKQAVAQGSLLTYFGAKPSKPAEEKGPIVEEICSEPAPLEDISNLVQPAVTNQLVQPTPHVHKVRTLGVRRSLQGWNARTNR